MVNELINISILIKEKMFILLIINVNLIINNFIIIFK